MAMGWAWWRPWGSLVSRDAGVLCVAGVALAYQPSFLFCVAGVALIARPLAFPVAGVAFGNIRLHFAWHAWGLIRSGIWRHPPSLCVARVGLDHIDFRFARPV